MSVRRARALLACALACCLASVRPVAAETERELGRRFYLEAVGQLPIVHDPALTSYVEGVGRRLVDALGPQAFDYRFFVVAHPALNAFAVPGGYVFVFSGLLARVKTDDELAGVLAHEIAHAHAHHISRMQVAGAAWNAAALAGLLLSVVNPVLGTGAMAIAQTAQLKYSRDFEREADLLSLRYTTDAGFDPHGLGSFFKELLAEQRLTPMPPPYMLSHPIGQERIANVEAIIASEKLSTPPGRPGAGALLAEVRAVCRAIADPTDVVVADYKREVDRHPGDPEAQFLLARVYETVGQLDGARRAYERAREIGGLGARVDRPLGSVYLALGRTDAAKGALERHLAQRPDDGFARLELGKALAAGGDESGALREYRRAIGLDADLDDAHRRAGIAFGRAGKQVDGFYHLAMAARLRGDLEQAFAHFERTAELLGDQKSARQDEVQRAIAELKPIVLEQVRERAEREQRRRRGPFGR